MSGEKKSDDVVKGTAKERTLEMWDNPIEVTPEDRSVESSLRTELPFDEDNALTMWASDAEAHLPNDSKYRVKIAKFKNGARGLQVVRFKDIKQPSFSSTLVFHQLEYYSLGQAIFRDSNMIKELILRFPEGTDPTVDKIRDFCKIE